MIERIIRVLVAKPGLDGHDRGAKVIVHALRESGMEVIYTGLHQTVEQIVRTAIQESVDVIGLSIMTGGHQHICKKLIEEMKRQGLNNVMVIVGGNIPKKDEDLLKAMGISKIFPTGSHFDNIVGFVKNNLSQIKK